jgi:hypothetical protein
MQRFIFGSMVRIATAASRNTACFVKLNSCGASVGNRYAAGEGTGATSPPAKELAPLLSPVQPLETDPILKRIKKPILSASISIEPPKPPPPTPNIFIHIENHIPAYLNMACTTAGCRGNRDQRRELEAREER